MDAKVEGEGFDFLFTSKNHLQTDFNNQMPPTNPIQADFTTPQSTNGNSFNFSSNNKDTSFDSFNSLSVGDNSKQPSTQFNGFSKPLANSNNNNNLNAFSFGNSLGKPPSFKRKEDTLLDTLSQDNKNKTKTKFDVFNDIGNGLNNVTTQQNSHNQNMGFTDTYNNCIYFS